MHISAAFPALAWLLTEVSGTLFPAFGVPDWGIRFVVIVVALAFLLADRIRLSPRLAEQPAAPVEVMTDTVQTSEPDSSESQYPPNSIAVLPFVNMSDDPGNEYFSDGISEELLNLLSKIPELRVPARTSSFSFKGKNLEIPEIAATVTAQLRVSLLGEIPKGAETNPEAYALHLQALAIDPDYAAAWLGLASNYGNQVSRNFLPKDEGGSLAREATERALAIDPDYAKTHGSLGWFSMIDNNLPAAARHFERALVLEPTDTDIISDATSLMAALGRPDEALAMREYVTTNNPVSAVSHYNLGWRYISVGRWASAIASFQTTLLLSPNYTRAHFGLGVALLIKGEPQAALAAISGAHR